MNWPEDVLAKVTGRDIADCGLPGCRLPIELPIDGSPRSNDLNQSAIGNPQSAMNQATASELLNAYSISSALLRI
jgi:hypothetical protein